MGKRDSDTEDNVLTDNLSLEKSRKATEFNEIFYPSTQIRKNAYIQSMGEYRKLYNESIEEPEKFWSKIASEFYFETNPAVPILEYNFNPSTGPIYTKFMAGAKTNVCFNMLDRHIQNGLGDKVAFYWEGNDPMDDYEISYFELHRRVCKFANALKSLGVQPGDVVAIYMPMVIEIVVAMLACVRIGAVHSVVFAGYSAQSLADRLIDGNIKVLITADGSWRGDKFMALKEICDQAIMKSQEQGHTVQNCVVLNHLSRLHGCQKFGECEQKRVSYISPFQPGRDKWWDEICSEMSETCRPEWVDAENPMFILYTSGSTGKPKGVVHSTAGYMIFASTIFKYSFDYHPEADVFWCTADMGWCCAHTNAIYGPLSLGGTSVILEGTPFYPDVTRPWSIIDKYQVSHFYTAPTVLRSLMKFGDAPVLRYKRDSLRVLGTVGEPINPQVWLWYYEIVGRSKCPIVDTYGQTETGGHLLTSLPGATPMKPGAVGLPFFGVAPVLLTKEGEVIEGPGEGCLVFSQPWPTIIRTVHGDPGRLDTSYFTQFPGYYCTGDAAKRDNDGYFTISGRVDDMLNVSGHLISTTGVQSAILQHQGIAEAAVVPVPHKIKGQSLYSFVILKESHEGSLGTIVSEVRDKVRQSVGSFAIPDVIIITSVLPMTRSGKILRRVLINLAMGESNFGDTSTLLDESVLPILMDLVKNNKSR